MSTDVRAPRLSAAAIALAASVLPLVAIHAGLITSIGVGALEPTFPYFDGATSISRACRREPSLHVFRALVLPAAPLGATTWWIAACWLRARGGASLRTARWVLGLGLAAALSLVLYATFLGTEGATYRLLRRYGVYVFFGGTAIAELITTAVIVRARPPGVEPWVRRVMLALCLFMLAAGPINIVADRALDHDAVANVLEWWFALGMIGYTLLLARIWSRGGVALRLDPGFTGGSAPQSRP